MMSSDFWIDKILSYFGARSRGFRYASDIHEEI